MTAITSLDVVVYVADAQQAGTRGSLLVFQSAAEQQKQGSLETSAGPEKFVLRYSLPSSQNNTQAAILRMLPLGIEATESYMLHSMQTSTDCGLHAGR